MRELAAMQGVHDLWQAKQRIDLEKVNTMFVESQTLDFKQLWKDDYLKTVCAFANGEGGQLLIGVNDNGEVVGIDNSKQLLETLPNKINNKLGLLVDVIPHQSKPFNPTMAAVFYKCGYIESWGRGTLNIIDYCIQAGLPKPEFTYTWGSVRTTFYKKGVVSEPVETPITDPVTDPVKLLLEVIIDLEMTPSEIQKQLGLKHRPTFRQNYLYPALEAGLIEMTIPDKPNSRLQKYRLTKLGATVLDAINNE